MVSDAGADIWTTSDQFHYVYQQLLTARAEMPQPTPSLINRFGDGAAQLSGQSSDDHSVFLVALVEGQVLAAARPRRQHRLDTHAQWPSCPSRAAPLDDGIAVPRP